MNIIAFTSSHTLPNSGNSPWAAQPQHPHPGPPKPGHPHPEPTTPDPQPWAPPPQAPHPGFPSLALHSEITIPGTTQGTQTPNIILPGYSILPHRGHPTPSTPP